MCGGFEGDQQRVLWEKSYGELDPRWELGVLGRNILGQEPLKYLGTELAGFLLLFFRMLLSALGTSY